MSSLCPIITSLREEHSLTTLLLTLLQQEQQHLIAADIDKLIPLTAQKSALVGQMTDLAKRRHAALATAGFPAQEAGMDAWLAAHGDAAAAPLWADVLAQAREAKELNRINGMLINKQMAYTRGAMNALRPAAQNGNVYGPSGQTTFGRASRGLVLG